MYVADYPANRVVAYDAVTGAFLWASHGGGSIGSVSVAENGVVWSGAADFKLYGIEAETGDVLVTVDLDFTESSPAIVDGVVYIGQSLTPGGDDAGALHAFGLPS